MLAFRSICLLEMAKLHGRKMTENFHTYEIFIAYNIRNHFSITMLVWAFKIIHRPEVILDTHTHGYNYFLQNTLSVFFRCEVFSYSLLPGFIDCRSVYQCTLNRDTIIDNHRLSGTKCTLITRFVPSKKPDAFNSTPGAVGNKTPARNRTFIIRSRLLLYIYWQKKKHKYL